MLELFRCRICGEVYFGKHPSHCPHCGAHERFMVKLRAWIDENQPINNLSDLTRKNLAETKELEYNATRFYKAAANDTDNKTIKGFFKYLARTEKEHYEVACKLLGEKIEDTINNASESLGDDLKNLQKSQEMEEHVSPLYAKFAEQATEPRAKEVFVALSEVEADHIELDREEIKELN